VNNFKQVLETQEPIILQALESLPERHKKFLLQCWIDVKERRLTGEQFSIKLKNYMDADSDTNNRNVMEFVKVVLTVEVEAFFTASETNKLFIDVSNNVITKTSGSWFDDGFSVGDHFDFYDLASDSVPFTGRIDTISDDGKRIVHGRVKPSFRCG
jgi:hypothetical protein